MGKNTKMNATAMDAKRKEKRNSIIITALVIVVAVLVIGLAVYNALDNAGVFLRSSTVLETENFEFDGAMMAYVYSSAYMNYSSYLSMLGVDPNVSLKRQECPFAEGQSWFDYFISTSKSQATEILALCEAAHEAGITLNDEDLALIDNNIETIKSEAATYGYESIDTYLMAMTGNPVKIDAVRRCLELSALASKYTTECITTLTYTADELAAYRDANPDAFLGVDLYSYSFNTGDYSFNDDSDAATLMDIAKKDAEALANNKTLDDFKAAIKALIEENTTAGKDETIEEFEQRKADLLESYLQKHVVKASLTEKVAKWAFEANLYETYVDSESSATKCTVYMLVKDEYFDESESRDVRHILFANDNHKDDTKAQEVFAKLEAEGFTEDAFNKYAAEYSEDPGSKDKGGLYENVFEGDMVTEFDAWLFDADRKTGDCEVIKAADTGWHIIYYAGEGDQVLWEADADAGLKTGVYDEVIAKHSEGVKFNEKALNTIDA